MVLALKKPTDTKSSDASPNIEAQIDAGLTAFFSISKEWGITAEQQRMLLGNPSKTTFFNWKKTKKGQFSRDVIDRLSYFIGIYKALNILFPNQNVIKAWLFNENKDPLFQNDSPLSYLLEGSLLHLAEVRRYLDWARG